MALRPGWSPAGSPTHRRSHAGAAHTGLATGDNPDRLRLEAAFSMLCGSSPIQAPSGKTIRHRLNRGGDRQANAALYRIVMVRLPPTSRAYPCSLSDAEWTVLQPLLQRPATPTGGRPPKHPLRAIVDTIRYLVRAGCAWRLLPSDFPPPGTVYWWFAKWAADGTLQRLHDALREQVRVAAGRNPTPMAAIVDSQSVRAADTVGRR